MEFHNLQFYRIVCFTPADPAEGAQGNEQNFLWCGFDDSELVIHGQMVIFFFFLLRQGG